MKIKEREKREREREREIGIHFLQSYLKTNYSVSSDIS